VQRLTATNPPPHIRDQPVRNTVFDVAESVSAGALADGSDTGNFAHHGDSKLLDSGASSNHAELIVRWNGTRIGTVKTLGPDANSLVKMHLVNSYLNRKANTWSDNWVWGSQTLNHRHNDLEEAAKAAHPANDVTKTSLNYETYASQANRPTAGTTAASLRRGIVAALNSKCYSIFGRDDIFVAPPPGTITVGGQTIASFIVDWTAELSTSATTEVRVEYRTAVAGAWGAAVSPPAVSDDPGHYTVRFDLDSKATVTNFVNAAVGAQLLADEQVIDASANIGERRATSTAIGQPKGKRRKRKTKTPH